MLPFYTRLIGVLIVFSLISSNGNAQIPGTSNMDVYILMGQSNMAGRGPIAEEMRREGNDSVYVFTKQMQWIRAQHPLHFDKPGIAAAGPGLLFGIQMAKANPGKRIGLVPCAVGGTAIELWSTGAYDPVTKTHPYDDAAQRIKAAMQYGTVKGILWHQGEANSSPEKAAIYLDQLRKLINRVRALVNNTDLPFIAGELGRFYKPANNINNVLAKLPGSIAHTGVVSSIDLTDKGDGLHFDGSSADKLGKRYAERMLEIQKQDTKSIIKD